MTRVLVYEAGVIGQIYAGRLMQAGHDVTLLARGHALDELTERGVSLRTEGRSCRVHPCVMSAVPSDAAWDVVLVTVRRDQVDEVVEGVVKLSAGRVVFMLNHSLDLDHLRERVGADRTIFAFPGVGGHRTDEGTIDYLEVPQQNTTVGRCGGIERPAVELLRSAGFAVDISDDMTAWLTTHVVFITTLGAAILASGADSAVLAADRPRVADAVAALFDALFADDHDLPFALFGHSMGAVVAYALAQRIADRGGAPPVAVLVSAARPPGSPRAIDMSTMHDEELLDALVALGRTPTEVVDIRDLMRLMIPTLRADLRATRHDMPDQRPLTCPIRAYGGFADSLAGSPLARALVALHDQAVLDADLRGRTLLLEPQQSSPGSGHCRQSVHRSRVDARAHVRGAQPEA